MTCTCKHRYTGPHIHESHKNTKPNIIVFTQRVCKVKKNSLSQPFETKNFQGCHRVWFLSIYWYVGHPALRVIYTPREIPLKRTDFSFVYWDCFWISDGDLCSLLSVLEPHLTQTHVGHVYAVATLWVLMCFSPVLFKGIVPLVFSIMSGSCTLFTSSSQE